MNRLPPGDQTALPSAFHAYCRSISKQPVLSDTQPFSIPNYRNRIQAIRSLHINPNDRNKDVLLEIFSGLKDIASNLLNNEDFFEHVKFYLTDANNLAAYQNIINECLTRTVSSGEQIYDGLAKRVEIVDELPYNKISYGHQTLETRLDGFDLIYCNYDPKKQTTGMQLIPVFEIRDPTDPRDSCFKIGCDISPDATLIIAESCTANYDGSYLGVSFIRPDTDLHRTHSLWTNYHTIDPGAN